VNNGLAHLHFPYTHSPAGTVSAILCLLLCHAAPLAFATPPSQTASSDGFEISSVTLQGNAELSTDDLKAVMSTRGTPGSFNKFLNSISDALGRKREYLDFVTLGTDVERLKQFYEKRGFSEVVIDTSLAFSLDDRTVAVTVTIKEGYRSIIDSLTYRGILGTPGTVWEDILADRKIVQGDPFTAILLEEEVRRVIRIFYDHGYMNAVYIRDSSYARRYASTRNYTVLLTFSLGRRYLFGEVTVKQEVDTLRGQVPRVDITDDIIFDHLDYQPGEFFSLGKKVASENNLSRLGLFELRRFDMRVPAPSDTAQSIPTSIVLRPLDKHELAPDFFVSDEDGAFNIGTGLSYTNRNFAGGARRFTTRLRFRTQTIGKFPDYFDKNSNSIANLDLTFEVMQPYVFSNRFKGTWSFSLILDKEKPYLQNIVRNKFGFTGRFAEYTTGYLDWALESSWLQPNQYYQSDSPDPDVQRALRLLQTQQFNSILSFTLQRDKTNDRFSPSAGFVHSVTVEEAGVLPQVLQSMFDLRSPFTQFYRFTLDGRWYKDLTDRRYSVLAFKLRAGWEEKYGASRGDTNRVIPQTNRFYAGGGNSVRGWNPRDLIARGDPQYGGNLLVEGNVEVRINLLQALKDGLLDKIWIVTFLDAGNLWRTVDEFELRTVAIATGLGFRYDTLFGPFRLDWGLRVYDPGAAPGEQWITQRAFFGPTIKDSVFHFGIGHAF